LKDQQLIKSFYNPNPVNEAENNNEFDANNKAVFDINWSSDGTVVAAGFEKSVVMLDIRKILSDSTN
jgi:hypothetical protein